MKRQLTQIGAILENTLKDFRTVSDTEMTKIWELWKIAVGEYIAKEAKPGSFRDGILIVHVSSSVWMQQLSFTKSDMLIKLNGVLKSEMIKDIKFKIAKIHN